jgi:hypothetical protein
LLATEKPPKNTQSGTGGSMGDLLADSKHAFSAQQRQKKRKKKQQQQT